MMNRFGNPGLANFVYDPDAKPKVPSEFDDEFDDGVINGWVTPAYDAAFDITQTNIAVHMSESLYRGFLVMQGNISFLSTTDFYKNFTVPITQPFTVVVKFLPGYATNTTTAENHFALSIRGQSDSYYFNVRGGRNNAAQAFRIIYTNGGGAAVAGETSVTLPYSSLYMAISHDGSKNFSTYVSGNGIGWIPVVMRYALANFTSFTRIQIALGQTSGQDNGILGLEFFRYFPFAGQLRIGNEVYK